MTVAALSVSPESPASLDVEVLVIGVISSPDGPRLASAGDDFEPLARDLSAIGFTGALDEFRRIPAIAGIAPSLALIGLGSGTTPHDIRYAAGSATRQLRGVGSVGIALPAETPEALLAVLEGAAIAAYSYDDYRSARPAAPRGPVDRIVVSSTVGDAEALVARATVIAGAIHTVRDLVNAPPSDLYPETFAQRTITLAEGLPVTVEVLREPELLEQGFGGILGVGAGSIRGPRLVKVTYSPASAERHLALVGKGITFDSGGLSLKPAVSMVGMKYDMTGAATTLAVILAAAQLGLDLKITAWLCLAENLPSGSAIRPNDVLTIHGGKTVEVLNTDAEGRLVLADGLDAASREHPDAIIDVATLTGAARVALGDRYVAVMGDDSLVGTVIDAAGRTGESAWPMPLPAELRPLLNSDIADIANVKPGNTAAGMLLAGIFLQEFVGLTGTGEDARRIPWAHLDIAGPANNGGSGYGFTAKGPTGVGVRALLAVAEEFSGS